MKIIQPLSIPKLSVGRIGILTNQEWIVKASGYLPSSKVATGCKYDKIKMLVLKPVHRPLQECLFNFFPCPLVHQSIWS